MIDTSSFERIEPDPKTPLGALIIEAREYLMGHQWCWHVDEIYLAAEFGAKVLLANVKPFVASVGPQVWVISGRLPLSYMDTRNCESPVEALAVYCVLTSEWIGKTLKKRDRKGCIELKSHGELRSLESAEEARACIPPLTEVVNSLISDQIAFGTLPSITQEELVEVRRIGLAWLEKQR